MTAGAGQSPGARAAGSLLARKEELAQAITGALYEAQPGLAARYGDAGRAKCLQDMRYTLEHLAPAVALGETALFARYAAWLGQLLGARGIPLDDVRASLTATERVLAVRLAPDECAAIAGSLRAAMGTLSAAGAE
ncbi:MAG TPA: hypothetical protein VFS08_14625 [Gemmatimonadaceae bacterium]|nr:hypothetical protein [Gemmatimonadaceae bacterium]